MRIFMLDKKDEDIIESLIYWINDTYDGESKEHFYNEVKRLYKKYDKKLIYEEFTKDSERLTDWFYTELVKSGLDVPKQVFIDMKEKRTKHLDELYDAARGLALLGDVEGKKILCDICDLKYKELNHISPWQINYNLFDLDEEISVEELKKKIADL